MRILLVGAGGVGSAFCAIAKRRGFFERIVVADYDQARAQQAADAVDDPRFTATRVDASSEDDVAALIRRHGVTRRQRGGPPLRNVHFQWCAGRRGRLSRHGDEPVESAPEKPYELTGVKLGDEQFEAEPRWKEAGRLALVGFGVEPGLSNVFARYAADHLFSEIDELGTRDGANLTVDGYDFAPSFSIWTTIEECLNPPVIWEKGRAGSSPNPSASPRFSIFPRASVRWSASTSSTRKCC